MNTRNKTCRIDWTLLDKEWRDLLGDDDLERDLASLEELDSIDDPEYDDFDHHDMCSDCGGSGWYVGLNSRDHCSQCNGAGWVGKGEGLNRYEAVAKGLV